MKTGKQGAPGSVRPFASAGTAPAEVMSQLWYNRSVAISPARVKSNFQLSPRTVARPYFVRGSSVLSPYEVRCASVSCP